MLDGYTGRPLAGAKTWALLYLYWGIVVINAAVKCPESGILTSNKTKLAWISNVNFENKDTYSIFSTFRFLAHAVELQVSILNFEATDDRSSFSSWPTSIPRSTFSDAALRLSEEDTLRNAIALSAPRKAKDSCHVKVTAAYKNTDLIIQLFVVIVRLVATANKS